jgi:hypothetical protein
MTNDEIQECGQCGFENCICCPECGGYGDHEADCAVREKDAATCKLNGGHVWPFGERECRDCGKPIEESYGYAEMTEYRRDPC